MRKSRIAMGFALASFVLVALIYIGKVSAGCGWMFSSPGVGYSSEYDVCYCAPY